MSFVIISMTTDAGFVYLLRSCEATDCFKIGKTNNPNRRFKEHGVPKKAKLIACWKVSAMSKVETLLLRRYKSSRVFTETFKLSIDNLKDLFNVMEKSFTSIYLSDDYKSYCPTPVIQAPTPVVTPKPVYTPTPVYSYSRPSIPIYNSPNLGDYLKGFGVIFAIIVLVGAVTDSYQNMPERSPSSIERQY